jgi:hypothetical protein
MVVGHHRSRIVYAEPSRHARSREEVSVLARPQWRASTEQWVESADSVDDLTADGHIRSVDKAGRQEPIGADHLRMCDISRRHRVVTRIVQNDASADVSGIPLLECSAELHQKLRSNVTVIIGEHVHLASRSSDPRVACVGQPLALRADTHDWERRLSREVLKDTRGIVHRAVIDHDQLPAPGRRQQPAHVLQAHA